MSAELWWIAMRSMRKSGARWFIYGRICKEGALGYANLEAVSRGLVPR